MDTTTRPAFRAPWKHGAHAYPQADTFAAAAAGFSRKRKNVIFHMPAGSEADTVPCAVCHIPLGETGAGSTRPDTNSTWRYHAESRRVHSGTHYACSWNALMSHIVAIPHA